MRGVSRVVLLALAFGSAPTLATEVVAVQCGHLVDGLAPAAAGRSTIVISDARITAVQRGFRAPKGARIVNLRALTCLPGLLDLHTHLTDRPEDTGDLTVYFRRKRDEQLQLSKANAAATINAGFTTVRNVGSYLAWSDRDLRDAINRGEFAGPRMQISGPYLTIPGGGGDLLVPGVAEADTPAAVREGVARGREQFRARAARQIAGGADVLKVIASGAVLAFGGVPGAPEMNPDELSAVVEVTHAAGLRVAAHAHGAQSIKDAIRAGVDTIEHASMIDDEGVALAKQHHVALAMDVYNGDYIDTEGRRQGWPAEFLQKNIDTTEVQRQGFTRALRAGVDIVFATDAGVYPHGLNAPPVPDHGAARDDPDAGDPGCDLGGSALHRLGRSRRRTGAGSFWRRDRCTGRPVAGHRGAAVGGGGDQGRRRREAARSLTGRALTAHPALHIAITDTRLGRALAASA